MDVQLADFSDLGSGELVKLILQADSARRQLDGYLAALLGRLGDLEGQDAVEELCRQFGLGRHKARQQAKDAGSLKALPATLEAVKGGWISIDHARVMGESHERAPLSQAEELELITMAISEDLDQFKKTVARGEDQRRADDGLTRQERQRERRSAKVFDGDNEMVILYAELDRMAGERVKTALHDLSDRLFREDAKSGSDRTHDQRNADALVALITQRPKTSGTADDDEVVNNGSDGDGIVPQATTLIVSVDYDTLSGQLKNAGLIDGPTDITNLVLLCPKCHKKVHKQGYQVTKSRSGQHRLKSPKRGVDGVLPRGPTCAAAA
ncbi:MAG: DUF222 domain-containing protein [bacterium]|nr:DUF222 domain-containing protein [bacterium]